MAWYESGQQRDDQDTIIHLSGVANRLEREKKELLHRISVLEAEVRLERLKARKP